MANYDPDPENIYYDEDQNVYVDNETGDLYYDDEGKEPVFD
ncbi:MAG TPA: hypothetical protein OIM49_02375 [Clostridiaceae bacterium]|jgi:hypothetical protein|nr:hypothetical protein [Clostridiaceae bacterium]